MREATVLKVAGGKFIVHDIQKQSSLIALARGRLKKEKGHIYPGDRVLYSFEQDQAVVESIQPRKNLLVRPHVANVDELVLVVSLAFPTPDLFFIDKIIALSQWSDLSIIICINKMDLNGERSREIENIYRGIGYCVVTTSAVQKTGIDMLKDSIAHKAVVFSGQSGVGKSTLLNCLNSDWRLDTNEVSVKLQRGKHTTKAVELLPWEKGYVTDTPGFSKLDVREIPPRVLPEVFIEFGPVAHDCYFAGCRHYKEPRCAVKGAVEKGAIAASRYQNYLKLLKEFDAIG